MLETELLKHIKSVLRISTNDLGIESEVKMLIESAKMDLQTSGIRVTKTNDTGQTVYDDMIVLAISLYCKANFGFDNPEADRFYQMYRTIETALALSTEYKEVIE